MDHEHHHRPQLQQEHKSINTLGSSMRLDITMALAVIQATQMGMILVALGHQNSVKELSRPWASAQSLVATGDMGINPDPDYCWSMASDITHGSNMAPRCSAGHPNCHNPRGSKALRHHQYGHRLQSRPQASIGPLVVWWDTDINIEPDYGRTTDSDMALSSSPIQDNQYHGPM